MREHDTCYICKKSVGKMSADEWDLAERKGHAQVVVCLKHRGVVALLHEQNMERMKGGEA